MGGTVEVFGCRYRLCWQGSIFSCSPCAPLQMHQRSVSAYFSLRVPLAEHGDTNKDRTGAGRGKQNHCLYINSTILTYTRYAPPPPPPPPGRTRRPFALLLDRSATTTSFHITPQHSHRTSIASTAVVTRQLRRQDSRPHPLTCNPCAHARTHQI